MLPQHGIIDLPSRQIKVLQTLVVSSARMKLVIIPVLIPPLFLLVCHQVFWGWVVGLGVTWELHFGGRDGGHSLGVLRLLVSFPKHVKRPAKIAGLEMRPPPPPGVLA